MARTKKYVVGNTVVFTIGSLNMVGDIYRIRTEDKRTLYDIRGEDGKEYDGFSVDTKVLQCINSKLTTQFNHREELERSIEEPEESID